MNALPFDMGNQIGFYVTDTDGRRYSCRITPEQSIRLRQALYKAEIAAAIERKDLHGWRETLIEMAPEPLTFDPIAATR